LSVVALASTQPTDGSTSWGVRKLGGQTGVGAASVHHILNAGQLKPHRTEYWRGSGHTASPPALPLAFP